MSLNVVASCSLASASEKTLPPAKDILKGILKNIPKSRRFQNQEWNEAPRKRIRVTLGVPFVYRLYQIKKKGFLKAKYDSVYVLFYTFSRRVKSVKSK